MTVANLKIGNKTYVVVPSDEFKRLQRENHRLHKLEAEDAAWRKMGEQALRTHKKSGSRGKPWEQLKRELGL